MGGAVDAAFGVGGGACIAYVTAAVFEAYAGGY